MIRITDPRWHQITTLSTLLVLGLFIFNFDLSLAQVAVTLFSVLLFQFLYSKMVGCRYEWRSALITGCSLCLLFRSNSLAVVVLAAALGIGSKFFIRHGEKHFFNPANFGIVAAILITGQGWVSPGQWGSNALLATFIICAGLVVITRARAFELTASFLGSYAAMIFLRAVWLGDRWAIPFHQLESGSLLLFSFFMISDPRSTPDTVIGRILFGVTTAALAYHLRFGYYIPNAFIYSLIICSPLTVLLDTALKGERYHWLHPKEQTV